jgi:uncharacterized membrane protein YkoI
MMSILLNTLVSGKAAGSLTVLTFLLTMNSAADDHNVAKRLKEAGNIVPLAKIVEIVSATRPGRLLDLEVDTGQAESRLVYHVELADAHGTVWYLKYDATQEALMRTRKGRDREIATGRR